MTTHRHIITSAVVALAVGATAGPAVAMPINVTATGSCGDACDGYAFVSSQPSAAPQGSGFVVTSQPTHVSQPAGVVSHNLCGDACDGYAFVSSQPSAAPQDSGFDWGDAGIGAAGGLTLSLLGIGAVMAVSHRRVRPGESAMTN